MAGVDRHDRDDGGGLHDLHGQVTEPFHVEDGDGRF